MEEVGAPEGVSVSGAPEGLPAPSRRASDSPTLLVEFSYDITRGIYEGRIAGVRFLFGGGSDSPIPKTLANALTLLRQATQETPENARRIKKWADFEAKPEVREALARQIAEFEARGGRVQTVGVARRKAVSDLSIEDLDI